MQDNGAGSLASRAKARREALLKNKTTTIEVPGYEGLLAMEYQVLHYSELRRLNQRHENQKDDALRELYTAADQLIAASAEAYEIDEDNGKMEPLGLRWGVELAEKFGIETFAGMTTRQALFEFFHRDVWVVAHWGQYSEWLSDAQVEADEVQREDFSPTT